MNNNYLSNNVIKKKYNSIIIIIIILLITELRPNGTFIIICNIEGGIHLECCGLDEVVGTNFPELGAEKFGFLFFFLKNVSNGLYQLVSVCKILLFFVCLSNFVYFHQTKYKVYQKFTKQHTKNNNKMFVVSCSCLHDKRNNKVC